MDDSHRRRMLAVLWVVLGGLAPGCSGRGAVEELPDVHETLTAVGKRLSTVHSPGELTALATRGDRVLAALTRSERDVLARGYLRFRVDRPVIVTVAAPARTVPFWLTDQGFVRSAHGLTAARGTEWAVFEKSSGAGCIGLGVPGLDRRVREHYVVFVRPESKKSGPIALELLDADGWRTTTAVAGVSLASDCANPLAALPDELRGATLLQPEHDRRHSTMLATGRVWKTHVVSGRAADQVVVSFGADSARSLVWTWRTSPEVTATTLRLRIAGDGSTRASSVRILKGDSQLVDSPNLLNDPSIRRHRVAVDGLEPGTRYVYALGDESSWKTVQTAPVQPDRFSLMYLGDAQCGLEAWGELLRDAYRRRPDVGVILLAGDLVDRGNERTNWDHFFLRAGRVFESVPLMPCVGNHEYLDQGPRLYRAFFDLPKNGPPDVPTDLVYSFEYGNACIAVLDSTRAVSDPRSARSQAAWLDDVLSRSPATWKFVMFHHPVYASHPSRESPDLRDAWVPVFDKHHVDLVLQGHDHAYLRTYPMRANRRVGSPAEGTVYVVSVSGAKYYEQGPRDSTAVGLTHVSTYQTIDVDVPGNRLTYRALNAAGREVDGFGIERPRSAVVTTRAPRLGFSRRAVR